MKTKYGNEYFEVTRTDDCIWLTDKRVNRTFHMTKSQAKNVAKYLFRVLEIHSHSASSHKAPSW